MKKLFLFTLGILLSLFAYSQEVQDVIYLKNGSNIKGTIVKQEPNSNIIIRTNDGQLYSFKRDEIEQILKEMNIDLDEYGGSFSYGISIGGGGLIGAPIRFIKNKFAFEMELDYKPGYFQAGNYFGNTNTYYKQAGVLSLGVNYYMGKYFKSKKQKIKLNGITIKGGVGTGDFYTYFIGGGWINESFKKLNTKKSFNLELGPGFFFTEDENSENENSYNRTLGLYWKVQWNWFK